ncbi:MAG: PAS domain S-box protein [Desulfobacteraceae bacterium]|nr:PAS domain S-box protein [Desulfobacteraceae bacterium]
MKLNWLNLEFETSSDNLENRFREKYFSSNLRHLRNCHLYTIAFYAAAGYIDYLFFKEDLFWLFLIRFLIVIPIFITGFFFSFSRYYKKSWQLISLFYVLLTGFSFIASMVIGDPPKAYDYYLGIFFCMVFGYTFIRLRFIYAAISGMVLLTAYLLVSKLIIDLPDYYLFLSTFYLMLINFLGMIISRHSEISARKDFHLEYVLLKAREEIVDLNNTLDERIKERTQALIEANKDLRNEISDRKRIERKLRETQNTFTVLFNEAPDPIFIINMEDKILDANIAACQMLGYTPDEYTQMSVLELQAPEVRTTQSGIIKKELLKGELFESMDIHKDGTRIPVEINNHRTIINGKEIVLSVVRDITKRKEIEETFKKLQAQLLQAQKMESVGRLAGGVAHDFNNMLSVILGHTELALLRTDDKQKLCSDLNEIQKAAKRSANITKQLLAFARKQTISPRQLDLNDTVESMLNMLRRLIGEDIDLVWQPAAHLWSVKMDPTQIDQILANLCVNARDAISGVGKLTIETGRKTFDEEYCNEHAGFIPGDFVLLAVSDNGCGMDKDTLDKLFEPFFTTKEVGKGTGLGLATIYGIVKQNNGFINVYSEPDQGSSFKIYLPRLVTDEDIDKAAPEKKAAAGGTETILLVEDEPTILRMTRMMLERKGYSVLSAATPVEAVDLAKTHADKIHLLMTDVIMPEMNGRDLAGQITARYPDIGLLFMSGYTSNVIAHHGVLDDGVAFIQKPFSMAEMTAKVREVLDMTSDRNQ